MSEERKGLGVFVRKKDTAGQAAPAPAGALAKPKDVKKRWLMVAAGVGVAVIAVSTLTQDKPPVAPAKKVAPTVSVNPPKDEGTSLTQEFGKSQDALRLEVEKQKAETRQLQLELERMRNEAKNKPAAVPPDGVTPPPSKPGEGNMNALPTGTPPPPPTPVTRGGNTPSGVPVLGNTGTGAPPVGVPNVSVPQSSTPGGAPLVFASPGAAKSDSANGGAAGAPTNATAEALKAAGQDVKARVSYRKNTNGGMLPAGAFAPVALLNGLDAGTSTVTQTNPMPVLMNIQDNATLPGAAKFKLRNCFVLGTGYGDLSAERVYFRFSRLSCVDKDNRLILSQEVAGYLVDSDGKLGMRGTVTDRQGAKLGKSLLAGFAQGLAGALGNAQSNTTQNTSTGMTTSTLTGASALRASGLGGAQVATSQLAEFYLKEAQNIFPVISVDASRTGTIVFTNSVSLNWGSADGQYSQQVTPTNENR